MYLTKFSIPEEKLSVKINKTKLTTFRTVKTIVFCFNKLRDTAIAPGSKETWNCFYTVAVVLLKSTSEDGFLQSKHLEKS